MGKKTQKAYKNAEFLNSRDARVIRILSEYIEPEKRFEEMGIRHTVVFFGSSRISPKKGSKMSKYYWDAEEFAFSLAQWSKELEPEGNGFYICTGGGPGIMEAANRGAYRAKSKTIGLNISLPMEQTPNKYITPKLNLEFHYFFMRKLWFLYQAKALVFFPGGFGTLDELFETLTLVQTGKIDKKGIPILLYDKSYWDEILDIKKLIKYDLISKTDYDLITFFSSPSEGVEILKSRMKNLFAFAPK
jgi:uncharacterized protein (TIGR00730 family)